MHRICLCPASIAWIRKHLQKSAKATFTRMISKGSISKIVHRKKARTAKQKKADKKNGARIRAWTRKHKRRR